ncbi:hypothetical protein A9Q98_08490 [Thalassotalea sp. 42_200_T64]|nr:hypothetical protein A9Q98_08490 [Thalassotalea sp. 42_200_T64]
MKKWILIVCGLTIFPVIGQQQAESQSEEITAVFSPFEQEFAQVNAEFLSVALFKEYYAYKTRNKFYHGKPPEGEADVFAREQKDELINAVLAAQQAKNQNLFANAEEIEKKLSAIDNQYAANEQWQLVKPKLLPMYHRMLEIQDLAEQYERLIKQQVILSEEKVKVFFSENRDKFTQPPQNHVAIILLAVEPSAGSFVWQAVREQINDIHQQLVDGKDFATLAELYSTDVTADQGGNMGLVHQGMISTDVEKELETMQPGEYTKPMLLLDGLAIFKLVERKPETVHSFEEVKTRAGRLAKRAAITQVWQDKLAELQLAAVIEFNENFQ